GVPDPSEVPCKRWSTGPRYLHRTERRAQASTTMRGGMTAQAASREPAQLSHCLAGAIALHVALVALGTLHSCGGVIPTDDIATKYSVVPVDMESPPPGPPPGGGSPTPGKDDETRAAAQTAVPVH